MKRPIITLLFFLLTAAAIAQTTQGTISLGGALGITTSKQQEEISEGEGEYKSSTLLIAPSAGYFLADGMELGLSVAFTNSKSEFDPEDGDVIDFPTVNETAIGPYFKYYMFTGNEDFAFTLNGSLLFGFSKTSPDDGDDIKGSSFQIAISPGFSYFFTDKIGLDFQLQGISFRKEDPNTDSDADNDEESTFTFGAASFSPSLGFKFYFTR